MAITVSQSASAPDRVVSRESGLEIFRILMMVLVIGHHMITHGGDYWSVDMPSWHSVVRDAMLMGGKVGVGGYVLISGYFLCTSQTFHWIKVVRLIVQTSTVSIVTAVVFLLAFPETRTPRTFVEAAFPLLTLVWWFATVYIGLYLVSPFLNTLIRQMSRRDHRRLVVIGLVLCSVLPTVVNNNIFTNNLLWFVFLYFLAAYVRLYPGRVWDHAWVWAAVAVVSYLAPVGLVEYLSINPLPEYWGTIFHVSLMDYNSLFTLGASFGAFLVFLRWKIGSYPVVNLIASTTFGIYLIHEHPLMRTYIWSRLAPAEHFGEGSQFFWYAPLCVATVFLACMVLDLARQWLIEKPIFALVARVSRDRASREPAERGV
ncbi:MAG: acyltransferase [Propionibacteriaceae bacterium]|nr:acyltransferase [Propionibacteriaceae bacterium]